MDAAIILRRFDFVLDSGRLMGVRFANAHRLPRVVLGLSTVGPSASKIARQRAALLVFEIANSKRRVKTTGAIQVAIGKFRCIVMNVTDLEQGERFWTEVTGLPVRFSAVGYPTRFSRLGDIASHSILLQLVPEGNPPPTNNAHLDLTVEDVDVAVQQALALGATLYRQKGTYPLGSPSPYLEWAVMRDPFGNAFCLIKDLG